MPNAEKLYILTKLRDARRINLTQMAEYCGLQSRTGRESVSKWERGESTPRPGRRIKFIKYLSHGLKLDRDKFQEVWEILVEEWDWDPLSEAEWERCFRDKGQQAILPPTSPRTDDKSKNLRETIKSLADDQGDVDDRRNKRILLERVKQFWIEGVLEKSLYNMVLLDLGKERQVEAVEHPWERVLELPDQSRQSLPPDKKIGDIFNEMERALLILGEPGSGKTITLLELARDLISRVEDDETFNQPIPVVFNLSTWTNDEPFIDWLVAELTTKYQIPKRIGRHWLENDVLLPLLDGLDEVRPENRATCIEAINMFGKEFGLAGRVICSRLKEYTDLPMRLKLNGAICLQPLTSEQVDNYLEMAGPKLKTLHTALQGDNTLQNLAQFPLMLNIMSLAYQDGEALPAEVADTVDERRKHLFDTYIERMFKRKGTGDKPYNDRQTTTWLVWLAQKMTGHDQTIFLIEQLQPSWLSSRIWCKAYILGFSLNYGLLVFGLPFGLFTGSVLGWFFGPITGLVWGLIGGLFFGLFLGLLTSVVSTRPVCSGKDLTKTKIFRLSFWLSKRAGRSIDELERQRQRVSLTNHIQTVEALSWSWDQAQERLTSTFYRLFLAACGFSGLLIGLSVGLIEGLVWGLVWGLSVGLSVVLSVGLFVVTTEGISRGTIETSVPNQGIWLSLRNATLSVLVGGLITALIWGLVVAVMMGLNVWLWGWGLVSEVILAFSLFLAVSLGLLGGLVYGLVNGGDAVIKHYVLRLILSLNGHIPWNIAHFLDYATERIFLQKVGGSYIFIHRLLLEHFAAMGVGDEE